MTLAQLFRDGYRTQAESLKLAPPTQAGPSFSTGIVGGIAKAIATAAHKMPTVPVISQLAGVATAHAGLYQLVGIGWTLLSVGIVLTVGGTLREARVI